MQDEVLLMWYVEHIVGCIILFLVAARFGLDYTFYEELRVYNILGEGRAPH